MTRLALWLFPGLSEGALEIVHLLTRKAGHFTEYAIFALLAARALRRSSLELLREHWFWVAALLVVIYSLTDEFHQGFYASRTASIYDCMIDSFGGLVVLTILWWRTVRTRRHPTISNQAAQLELD